MKTSLPRSVLRAIAFGVFALSSFKQLRSQERQTIALGTGWEFHQRGAMTEAPAAEWLQAEVPGDVHLDLLRHRLIPDPFYRDNEAKLQWIGLADWEYRTSFVASPELLQKQRIELVFEGLDAACDVFLNDKLILSADNMFRIWRIETKPWLKSGHNQLRLLFHAHSKAAEKLAATDPQRVQKDVAAKTYIRKAAYEYGWDWGPVFVTSGIWRPVSIEAWDEARISDLHIRQRDVTAEVAHLTGEMEVTASAKAEAEVTVQYSDDARPVKIQRKVALHAGVNRVDIPIEIGRPKLWYPAGYGEQPLYVFKAEVKIGSQTVDRKTTRAGLRTVVLRREVDEWGRSFELVVNGIPIFAKGANVIPFDSFPNRVSTANYRRILESAKAANMNIVRQWGGGYYETDEFYSQCDELGLMVWQDFMFGNEMQPGTYPFKLSVAQEAEDQLKRLRNHPSIVLWCGNNETEGHFGWTGMLTDDPAARLQMWKDYITISSGILGQAVAKFAPETPFWPSSPSADYESTSPAYESGDFHDWSIWHGRAAFADYAKHNYRFVSEYGFQSFPEMRTVESFTAAEDRASIFTPVMLAHQRSSDGNALIHEYMLRDYSEPKDFSSFLYVSQVLQAEGVKLGVEHMRRNRPRCMGSIFWQLNDCWPVASWSSIDYFGRWKALQYYARRFYAPLLVSPRVENEILAVYIVSDLTQPTVGKLRVRLITSDGLIVHEQTVPVEIPALSSKIYLETAVYQVVPRGMDSAKLCVATELSTDGKVVSRNLIYLQPTKQVHLPVAHISAEVFQDGDRYRIHLTSDRLARSVEISCGMLDVELSDNFFDLLPGEAADIQVRSTSNLEDIRKNLVIRSLADAFGQVPSDASQLPP